MSLLDDMRELDAARKPAPTTAGPGEFRKGLRSGYESAAGQLNTLAGGIAEKLGANEFAQERYAAAQEREKAAQATRPRVTDFREAIDSPRNFVDYVAGGVGSSIPVSLAAAGGALLTRGRGVGVAPSLRAAGGATAATAPFETGEAIQRQQAADPGKEIDLLDAARTGTLSAGVQSVVPAIVAGQALRPLSGAARQGIGTTVARNAADIPLEAATEAAGTGIQQAGATAFNPNRDTSGDIEELKQAAAGGAAGGLGFAGTGTAIDLARRPAEAAVAGAERLGQVSSAARARLSEGLEAGQEAVRGAMGAGRGAIDEVLEAGREGFAGGREAAQRARTAFGEMAADGIQRGTEEFYRAADGLKGAMGAGREAIRGSPSRPEVAAELEAVSIASEAALASAKSAGGRAQEYFSRVAPDLTEAAQAAAASLRESTQAQVKRAREIYADYQKGGFDSLPEDLRERLERAGQAVGSASNRAFLFTMKAYRKSRPLAQQALNTAQDTAERTKAAIDRMTSRIRNRAPGESLLDAMINGRDEVDVTPDAPPEIVEGALRQWDERLRARAGEFASSLMSRADIPAETRARLEEAAQDLNNKANRAYVATQQRAAQGRDEAARIIDELWAKFGPERSKKSLVGADDGLPAIAQGLRDAVMAEVVPLIEQRYPTLMQNPDRINRVAEVMRGAIESVVNGTPLDKTDREFMRRLIGDENTAQVLRGMYQAMNLSTSPEADRTFFAELNKLDAAERDRRALRDFVAANLTEQAQRTVKTTDLDEIVDDIQSYVEGRDSAFRTPDEAAVYMRQVEDALVQAFGPNAEAVMARFEAARPDQKLARDNNAEDDGEAGDDYEAYGPDALEEQDATRVYYGAGRNQYRRTGGKRTLKLMESPEAHRAQFNNEGQAERLIRELKEKFPDRDVRFMPAREYGQLENVEVSADDTRGVVVVEKPAGDDKLSADDIRWLKPDARYADSPTVLAIDDKTSIDTQRLLTLMGKRMAGSGVNDGAGIQRKARLFMDGIAAVQEALGKTFPLPDELVAFRHGKRNVTVAEAREEAFKVAEETEKFTALDEALGSMDRAALMRENVWAHRIYDARVQKMYEALRAQYGKAKIPAAAQNKAREEFGVKEVSDYIAKIDRRLFGGSESRRESVVDSGQISSRGFDEPRTVDRRKELERRIYTLHGKLDKARLAGDDATADKMAVSLLALQGRLASIMPDLDTSRKSMGRGRTEVGPDAQIHEAAATNDDLTRSVDASGFDLNHYGPSNAFRTRLVKTRDGRERKIPTSITDVGLNVLDSRAKRLEASVARKYRELGAKFRSLLDVKAEISDSDMLRLYTMTAPPPDGVPKSALKTADANRTQIIDQLVSKYIDGDGEIDTYYERDRDYEDALASAEPEVSARGKKQRLIERARSSDPELLAQIEQHTEPKGLQRSVEALNDWLDNAEGLSDEDIDNTARVVDAMNARIRDLISDDPTMSYGMMVESKKSLVGTGRGQYASMIDELVVNGDVYRAGSATVVRADTVAYEGAREEYVDPPKAYYMEGFTEDGDQFSGWYASEDEVNAALAAEGIFDDWQEDATPTGNIDDMPFSRIGAGQVEMTTAQRQEVKAYIDRVLAGRMRTEFARMPYAGEFFAGRDTTGAIRLSVYALDPMSTAYHEALHGFFHQLRKNKQNTVVTELIRAASTPHVMRQLNELLKNEPAALKQLADPEERAAYMYQLYAGGALTVRDKGIRGMMKAVTDWIRATLGLWSNEQNALRIMEYFHSGEYAANIGDRSAVGRVLAAKAKNSALQKAGEFTAVLSEGANKLAAIGHTRLRDTNIPALIDIADRIKRPLTQKGDDPGFIPAARVARTEWLNKFAGLVQDLTPEQLDETLEALQQADKNAATSREARIAAFSIRRQLLDPFYEYLTKDAGVKMGDMGFGKDYFPRAWDPVEISKNLQAFEAMLDKYVASGHISSQAKQPIISRLINGQGAELQVEVDRPGLMNAKTRTLAFIEAKDAAPFMKKDLFGIIDSYITQGTRRAEWTRRFGDEGKEFEEQLYRARAQGATEEQIEQARDYARGVNGTLGDSFDPRARRIMGDIIVYQNIRLLPLAIFSSVVDPMGVMVNGGTMKDAWNTFKRGIREMPASYRKNPKRDDAYELAEMLGTIDNIMLTNVMGQLYSQGMVGETARKINDKFFKYNLMEQFNLSMRVGATEAAINFIGKHGDGTATAHSKRWMQELGIDGLVMMDNGKPLLTAAQFEAAGLSKAEAVARANKMKAAVNTWVDGAILRPDAADRPTWFNDPRWVLITHLKQFTYSFHQTILKRVFHEYENGNYRPAMALASYVPVMLAADLMKGMLQGGGELPEWKKDWTLGDHIGASAQRAGLFGVGQIAIDGYGGLVGPSISQLSDVVQAVDGRRSYENVAINAMPANSLYKYWSSEEEAGDPLRDR